MNRKDIERYIKWESFIYSRAVNFWFKNIDVKNFSNLKVLEIGGGNNCEMAEIFKSLGAYSICSDIFVPNNLNTLNISRYERLDALNIPYEDYFDIISFKSVLGGLARNDNFNKRRAISEIYKALKPNGYLLFVENLEGCFFHKIARKYLVSWGRSWNYLKISEVDILLRDFNYFEYKTFGVIGLFAPYRFRNYLGKLDLILEKLFPKKCQYLISVVARK